MTPQNKPDLLIVDDDPLISDTLSFVLGTDFSIYTAESRGQAKSVLRRMSRAPDLALIDLGLPPTPHRPDEGFRLVTELVAHAPEMQIVVLSGQSDEANARHARTLGAFEFVHKPCEPDTLRQVLLRAVEVGHSQTYITPQRALWGSSAPISALRQQISQFADAPFPVLIEGESGSGKELVARSLHTVSHRSQRPFLVLNCAAISPSLVEPTLFGYARGAFTGATGPRSGYFEEAQDSTLLLDEIGELPLELQAKLHRVLENGEFQRVGETRCRVSNARVIAATNRDMRHEIRSGRFRADLYHRLSVFKLNVPALRELGDDKRLLLERFREHYAREAGVRPFQLDARASRLWAEYGFPGNVRELRNIVIRLMTKHAGEFVTPELLECELDTEGMAAARNVPSVHDGNRLREAAMRQLQSGDAFNLDETLHSWERGYVEAALALTQGNLTRAARLLGMHRTTLYSRMQNYANSDLHRQTAATDENEEALTAKR